MASATDIRTKFRTNCSPELAMKYGKLLGATYKNVAVCTDKSSSAEMISRSLVAGIISMGANVEIQKDVSAPSMPFVEGADCYVVVALHGDNAIAGMELRNIDGSLLTESQIFGMMSKENSLNYPSYKGIGEISYSSKAASKHIDRILETVGLCRLQLVVDRTYEVPSRTLTKALIKRNADIVTMRRWGVDSRTSLHETDLRDLHTVTSAFDGSMGLVLNNDGTKLAVFDEELRYVSGAKLAALFAKMLKSRIICAPIDASMALDDVEGAVVVRGKETFNSVNDLMKSSNADFGTDCDGSFIFPDISYAADGIAAGIKLSEFSDKDKIADLLDSIQDYPRTIENVRISVDKSELYKHMSTLIPRTECNSIIDIDGFRLNFDSGWIWLKIEDNDSSVRIVCEARDKAYLIGLLEIAKTILEDCIKLCNL